MTKSHQTPLAALGAALRKRRDELGMSQEEVARQAKLDRSYVGGVERGERNVAFINICKLAKAVGLSAAALVERAEKE